MFSKYKKGDKDASKSPDLKPIQGGQDKARVQITRVRFRRLPRRHRSRSSVVAQLAAHLAQATAMDKERKRKERLGEIKLELHKRLLDNLNLSALEQASESDLRSEIVAISGEALDEMGVVLNREERQTLNQDFYDEVTGLGPLEPLLKGRHGQRYSGQRPATGFCRTRRSPGADRHDVQGRKAPFADHRQDRLRRGSSCR